MVTNHPRNLSCLRRKKFPLPTHSLPLFSPPLPSPPPSALCLLYTSGPQSFWHQGPVSQKTIFPWTGGGGGNGSGGNASDGEQQMKLRSLASCCAARFLTGQGLAAVHGLGVGDPCSRHKKTCTARSSIWKHDHWQEERNVAYLTTALKVCVTSLFSSHFTGQDKSHDHT